MNYFGGTFSDSVDHILQNKFRFLSYLSTLSIFKFILTVLILLKHLKAEEHNCILRQFFNKYTANCSNNKLRYVPQDLDHKIKVLDLSYNQILQLNDTSFKRYFRLKKLIFSHNGYPLEGSPHTEMVFYTDYCFAVISNLEELDLSNTYFGSIVTMVWPSNLKVLKINDGFHELLNFSDLVYLREVRAARNRLKHLPDFHFLSPLSILDLSHNKLGVFTPDKISPFCLLSYFAFELTDDFGLKENYCSCNYLKKWLDMINIRGTPAIGCYDDSVRDYNCMQNFDYLWNDYYQCLGRHPLGFMKPIVVCFAVFSIITISILVVIFITKTQGDEEYSDEEEFEEEDD